MATGLNRITGQPLTGWPYTVQCLNVVAETMIGARILDEYFGSLNPGLLVKENFTEGPLDRFTYALITQWELWVPMFSVKSWAFQDIGEGRSGGIAILFNGEHLPNAHLGDYSAEGNRIVRAMIAANAIEVLG